MADTPCVADPSNWQQYWEFTPEGYKNKATGKICKRLRIGPHGPVENPNSIPPITVDENGVNIGQGGNMAEGFMDPKITQIDPTPYALRPLQEQLAAMFAAILGGPPPRSNVPNFGGAQLPNIYQQLYGVNMFPNAQPTTGTGIPNYVPPASPGGDDPGHVYKDGGGDGGNTGRPPDTTKPGRRDPMPPGPRNEPGRPPAPRPPGGIRGTGVIDTTGRSGRATDTGGAIPRDRPGVSAAVSRGAHTTQAAPTYLNTTTRMQPDGTLEVLESGVWVPLNSPTNNISVNSGSHAIRSNSPSFINQHNALPKFGSII